MSDDYDLTASGGHFAPPPVSAGVPHDTPPKRSKGAEGRALVSALRERDALAAELARVSSEHETMRNALAEARRHLGPHAKAKLDQALAAGSRVEDTGPCPADHGDACCGDPVACRAALSGSRVEDNQ